MLPLEVGGKSSQHEWRGDGLPVCCLHRLLLRVLLLTPEQIRPVFFLPFLPSPPLPSHLSLSAFSKVVSV